MSEISAGFLSAALACAISLAWPGMRPSAAQVPHGQLVSLSVRKVKLNGNERVVGFHLDVQSGRIERISEIPIGWDIDVNNDPSWNTKVDGSIRVAAAALGVSFFQDFLLIEKEPSAERPLTVQGEIDVSKDFANVRKIPVVMKDLVIRPVIRSVPTAR